MAQAEVEAVAQTLFDRLSSKVTPVINAGGANTEKSGSHMRPEALEAITQASESFFSINELLDAGGEMVVRSIEEVNGPVANLEAAMICAGAATGMSLMAAAALSRGDSERRAALPRSEGFPNELVVQRTHSIAYDQSWETTGGRLVFAGDESGCERTEFVAKIGPNTAALIYLAEKPGTLTLEDIVEIAAEHGGLPVLVDSASVLGGAEARWRLSKYLAAGADMACYKGGAGIRGPQSTGLVLGKAEFIADCRENGFPNQSVLRAAKVCKEEIFGLIAAVEGFMAEDDEALTAAQAADMQTIVDAVGTIPGIVSSVIDGLDGSGPK